MEAHPNHIRENMPTMTAKAGRERKVRHERVSKAWRDKPIMTQVPDS